MKKFISGIIALVAVLSISLGTCQAAEVGVSLDFASAYVFRGVTFNDGFVAQPGIEVSGLPVTFGVWANLDIDDYDGALSDSEISEIDIYLSYDLPVGLDPLGLSIGYTEYTYPSAGGEADRELSLTASVETFFSPSIAVYAGLDGAIESSFYLELGGSHDLEITEDISATLSAAVGYVEPDEGESGFSHANIGISASYKCLSAGVTYVAQIDDDVLPDGAGAYDAEVYGTLGVSHSF